jgi:hypothetical protein
VRAVASSTQHSRTYALPLIAPECQSAFIKMRDTYQLAARMMGASTETLLSRLRAGKQQNAIVPSRKPIANTVTAYATPALALNASRSPTRSVLIHHSRHPTPSGECPVCRILGAISTDGSWAGVRLRAFPSHMSPIDPKLPVTSVCYPEGQY